MLDKITKPEKLTWLLFALVVIAIYFFALDLPLLGPDEPRYSQVAREMFERGDWVTTTLGGFNWFEKPALLYWLQIAFYNLFGVSEFSARFGSALFGLGTVASLFLLGRSVIANSRNEHNIELKEESYAELVTPNAELPYWLALVTASSIGLIAFSRGASFDIILTFPITASLVAFFIFDRLKKSSSIKYYLPLFAFYFFIGVALLAKGLVGIVFPFAIVTFYFVLRLKLPSKTLLLSLFWGTLVSIIVASVWYLPAYLQNGWEFIDEFFIQHHFQRFSSNKYLHPQPFWFFWLVLPAMTIPWLPFFIASIWKFGKEIISRKGAKEQSKNGSRITNYELRLFAFAWLLVPLVFFSISGSKLPGYILPSLPAACILVAEFVSRFTENNRARKFALQLLAFAMFGVVVFLLVFELPKFAVDDSVKALIHASDSRGTTNEKILNFQTVSHNAEFYGAGRLIRLADGKQRRFDTVDEIDKFLTDERMASALILTPPQFVKDLAESSTFSITKVDENKKLVILEIRRK